MKKENVKTIIALLFVITGIAGLIYQIVWFKYLGLFLGNTTYAQMTVLAVFLGGLAFGNHLFGKRADRLKNPIFIYSVLEIFIGVYCLLYPSLNSKLGDLFLSFSSQNELMSTPFLFTSARFVVAAFLLFLPTTAMGGTLPILSSFFVEKIENTRKEVAALYFLNSFGAVVGIMFAGFVLIKEFGLNTTIYATAFLNLIAGFSALYISLGQIESEESKKFPEQIDEKINSSPEKRIVVCAIIVVGISGMAALLYEMVWVRLLINFLGSSTYAFSIMLMAFIGGITLGSFVVSQKAVKRFNQIKLLTFLQASIALSTMIILLFYERLPYYLWKVSSLLSRTPESFEIFLFVKFLICFSLMFLPTLFMGMSLPVATEIVSSSNNQVGLSVGKVFSVNTIGTVVGVVLTGLFFIPMFGIKTTFEIGIGLNLLAASLLLLMTYQFNALEKIFFGFVGLIIFVSYLLLFPGWNEKIMLSGVFRTLSQLPPATFEDFTNRFEGEKIVFYEEGVNANVAVTQSILNPLHKRLIINGKPDASSYYDMPTQILSGEIPMMLHKNPKNVFVVGFGSGTTIGSVLVHPVDKVVCAEISKEVISAASHFKSENKNCIEDPRFKIYNEDAITFLKLSKEKYDVIISEPSNPWIAGIGNLFSKEYFSECLSKLNPDGIMVQWLQLYEADDSIVKLVLNTFSSVFPYAQIWNGTANDLIIVGSKNKITLDFNLLVQKFYTPEVKEDFERIGINNPFTFLFTQSISPRGFDSVVENFPINSETHPLLEFLAPRSFYVSRQSAFLYYLDEKFEKLSTGLYIKEFAAKNSVTKEELKNTIEYSLVTLKNYRAAFGLSKYALSLYPNDYELNILHSHSFEKLEIINARKSSLEKLVKLYPDSVQIIKDYNNILINEKINAVSFINIFSIEKEAELFLKTTSSDSVSQIKVFLQLADVFLKNSELDNAEKMLLSAENYLRKSPNLLSLIPAGDFYYLGSIINLYKKNYDRLLGYYTALINFNDKHEMLPSLRKLVAWDLKNDN
jgi:spermidine synthase/tetratricopeptide (TPR) repeat protein